MKSALLVANLFATLFSIATAQAQLRSCPAPAQFVPQKYQTRFQANIDYCKRATGNLKLDIARPKATGIFPAIVFVHGGAWMWGSKDGFPGPITLAASKGFVAIAINYRLTKMADDLPVRAIANPFPAHLRDVECAVAWLKANAQTLQVDAKRIGLFGESAGAHLSLLAGLQDKSGSVKGVATFYPPTELDSLAEGRDADSREVMEAIFGGGPGSEASRIASPMTYVTKSAPPMLTVHGTRDDLVPYSQGELLDTTARTLGARHELVTCPNEGHGFTITNRARAFEHVFSFFKRTL